jgi:hypothetical protein
MRRLTIWLMLAGVSAVPGSVAGQDSLKLREPLVRPGLHAQVNASREQITGVVATVALSPGSSALEQGSTQQIGASLRSASEVPVRGSPFPGNPPIRRWLRSIRPESSPRSTRAAR